MCSLIPVLVLISLVVSLLPSALPTLASDLAGQQVDTTSSPWDAAAPGTQQFKAQGHDAGNDSIRQLRSEWSTDVRTTDDSDPFIAPGTAEAKGYEQASSGSNSGEAPVDVVTEGLDHIDVMPSLVYLPPGGTRRFHVRAYDSGNNAIPGLVFDWSTDPGSIDDSGLFTAQNTAGVTGYVRAACGSVYGEARVCVVTGALDRTEATSTPLRPSVAGGNLTSNSRDAVAAPSFAPAARSPRDAQVLQAASGDPSAHGLFSGERLPVGYVPSSVGLGDLDGDGTQDLVTANYWSGDISVFLGNGNGTFSSEAAVPLWGFDPLSMALGDLSGDGNLDIVTANSGSGDVSVLLGNGDGTFTSQVTYLVGDEPSSVALGDLSGDGSADIVTANTASDNVSVLLGNGDGTFASQLTYSVGDEPSSVALGDLNGDGSPDIVTANTASDNVSVLLGNGDGTFPDGTTFWVGDGPVSVALGELNGDGSLDLVAANYNSDNTTVFRGNGDGTFAYQSTQPVGDEPSFVVLRDLNHDGALDIVTANARGCSVSVWLGSGSGAFSNRASFPVGAGPGSVAVGDLNGDVLPDIVTANAASDDLSVLPGRGDGTFASVPSLWVGDGPKSVALGDLNNDGDLDIVTANYLGDNTSTLVGNGNGTFGSRATFPVGDNPNSVALGDLNGDGALDIVTTNASSDNVSVLLGTGNATFASQVVFSVGDAPHSMPYSVALGDLNGDGALDIVTANANSDNVSVLLGTGNGTFASQAVFSVGDAPYSVALGDMNNDSYLDAVTANFDSSDVSVLLGNGDGSFATQKTFSVYSGCGVLPDPRSIALGDLNEDGDLDIVTANGWTDDLSLLLSKGDGSFALHASFSAGCAPCSVALGDLNGDGALDIVTADSFTNSVRVRLGHGDGTFASEAAFGVGDSPCPLALGHLNGDGALDVLTASYNGDSVSVSASQRVLLSHSPRGATMRPVDTIQFLFPSAMDNTSFSVQDDIVSFMGPSGNLLPTAHSWLNSQTLEITFEPQSAAGVYEMVIGPQILDSSGHAMNIDRDSVLGEIPDDRYTATFAIRAPRVIRHVPTGLTQGPVDSIGFDFDLAMDQTSFSTASDIVSFTGPSGSVTPTGYSWLDDHALEVTFEAQNTLGKYQMAIGPEILDAAGNALDIDRDFVPAEAPDDQYVAAFRIAPPRVVGCAPSGSVVPPVASLRFNFDHVMDETSFSVAEDIMSFKGPSGDITVAAYSWVTPSRLELSFDRQFASGVYEMLIGPLILDSAGHPLNIDHDAVAGEVPDDEYMANFQLLPSSPGVFPAEQFRVSGVPSSLALGDINSDGKLDLVTACYEGIVSLLLGNGYGAFQEAFQPDGMRLTVGAEPSSVALGDLNNDGALDIVTANVYPTYPYEGGSVSVLLGNGDSTFASEAEFAVGVFPQSVALGDLNRDGNLDSVTANSGSDNVSVLLGSGDGTFAPQVAFSVGINPRSVALGDLNRDACLDIVTVNSGSNDVSVLLGNGDGTFTSRVTCFVGSSPQWVALGDLNGDGALDIVTANYESDDVSILLGNNDGTFAQQSISSTGTAPLSVALADVNGDGVLDIVTANGGSDDISVLLGKGDGTFTLPVSFRVGTRPQSMVLGELDGDCSLDVVAAHGGYPYYDPYYGSGSLTVLLGNGDGTFPSQATFAVGDDPSSVALGDLNGDGCVDLVTANGGDDTVSALLSNCDSTFANQVGFPVGDAPSSVTLGDLDGDGNLDIVTANSGSDDVSVLLGIGDGTFADSTSFPVGNAPSSVILGDLDGDDNLDIVTANSGSGDVSVLLGNGDGTFAEHCAYPIPVPYVSVAPSSLALGDLDEDGDPDIAAAYCDYYGYSSGVVVLLGDGTGSLALGDSIPLWLCPNSMALGDLNNDGNLDIVASGYEDYGSEMGYVEVTMGNGDGTFQYPDWPGPRGEHASVASVALGDVNVDGCLDVVTASPVSDTVSLLLGVGDGTLAPEAVFLAGHEPEFAAMGDLNGDGYPDVVTANSSDDTVSILLNQAAGIWHSPRRATTGPVDRIRFHFDRKMDTTSFSPDDDIASFTAPSGGLTANGSSWLDSCTLEITFEPQSVVGEYEMVIGPDIVDSEGIAMDLDQDSITGEVPDDRYTATFTIKAPRLLAHRPSGRMVGPAEAMQFDFDHDMDDTSFSIAEDIVSFTGPLGNVTATGYEWLDSDTLEVTFEAQYSAGEYKMVVGPQILDVAGYAMDQDRDFVAGETPDDLYGGTFSIRAPRVVAHAPSGSTAVPVSSMHFDFDLSMDHTSFSTADDIVSFIGPEGAVAATGHTWVDSDTLEVTFDPQYVLGTYEMVIGPDIWDSHGNAMNQDGDQFVGEVPDDRYVGTFEAVDFCEWSGDITSDTTWDCRVIVVDGPVTVASGATLTVQAGTIVKFSSGINVQGSLEVLGTFEQPVILTSWRDDSAGGDTNGDGSATSPAAGDWQGVSFLNSGLPSALDHVVLRYATTAVSVGTYNGPTAGFAQLNGVTLDHNVLAIEAGSAYSWLEAQNTLVVGNSQGFLAVGTAGVTFRNCTIVGNTKAGEVGHPVLTLENSIIAFNTNGLSGWPTPDQDLAVRNSDFYGLEAQTMINWLGQQKFNADGNINADPLFVDRGAGDYELSAGSPCIDSGRGSGAPASDILGRPRHDDLGMPNRGTGYPSYVDIGAFERQEDTAAGDLAVTYVSDPTPAFLGTGDSFTVQWTVTSVGLADCPGPWLDKVYLSADPYLSSDDSLLEQRTHVGGLSSGASYTETLTAVAPAIAGPRHVVVRTNAQRSLPEPVETNNVEASSWVLGVNVPILTLDAAANGTAVRDQWSYVRFEALEGHTVVLGLDAATSSGAIGLYVRYGVPPTMSEYDAAEAVPNTPDQQVRIPSPFEGAYYIGVYATYLPAGSTQYTISAQLTPLDIRSVSPNRVGNAGNATLRIEGDNFSPGDEIRLVAPDGVTQLSPDSVYYQDPAFTFATFDLVGAPVGVYDLTVTTAEGDIATLADCVTVTAGAGPRFHASLSMPGTARPNRVISIGVDYSNQGTNDLRSPLLTLSGPDDCAWQLPGSEEWVTSPKLRLMALSTSGPANILRAGQAESLQVKVRTPFSPGTLHLTLDSLGARPNDGSEEPIDWFNQYGDLEVAEIVGGLLGVTGHEYVMKLGAVAAQLAPWEGLVYSADQLEWHLWMGDTTEAVPLEADLHSVQQDADVGNRNSSTVFLKLWKNGNWTALPPQLDPGRTAVIIHGYDSRPSDNWVRNMATALAKANVPNVIAVDWEDLAKPRWWFDYGYTASHIPEVAETTYRILKDDLHVPADSLHLIGHSHGAHIAGLVGKKFGRVDRVTALEPSEEGVHGEAGNKLGRGWGGDASAKFVDSYKSSGWESGETAWGHDNFLVRDKSTQSWAGHNDVRNWFTSTITADCAQGRLRPGYCWDKDSWDDMVQDLPGDPPGSGVERKCESRGPLEGCWRGITHDVCDGVIECFTIGTDQEGAELWRYPGSWPGEFNGLQYEEVEADITPCVEMETRDEWATIESDLMQDGVPVWKIGKDGTIRYSIINHADNSSIPEAKRLDAQVKSPTRIIDRFWLSEDQTLDSKDIHVDKYSHKGKKDFLPSEGRGGPHEFTASINLPSAEKIRDSMTDPASWPENELSPIFYLFVDAGSCFVDAGSSKDKITMYSGELRPDNNRAKASIRLYEGLCANAGEDQEDLVVHSRGEKVLVTLDGTRSGPEELISRYQWSTGETGQTASHSFGEGRHTVRLTVTIEKTGESDTDDVVIWVRLEDPLPDGDDEDSDDVDIVTSVSPEDKWGPAGYDAPTTPEGDRAHYISGDQTVGYRIEIWNKPDAPAPTQDATIDDVLDPALFDLSTFEFTRVGFLKWDVLLPGVKAIDTRVDTRPDMNIAVDVKGTLDPETGAIRWWFHTVDPMTGDYPEDPMAGFLPPYNPETGFEIGWVEFRVKPKDSLPTGTQIANQAFVQFDFLGPFGPAPKEGPWVNTIDSEAPSSQVNSLPAAVSDPYIVVSWNGNDGANGSGIASYDIYVSQNGGNSTLWIQGANSTTTQAAFTGEAGLTYAFYSIATDNVGNVEDPPDEPDASVSFFLELAAECNASPTTTEAGKVIGFGCTPSEGVPPYSFSWDFGDGGNSTEQNPTYAYVQPGRYTACVTVTDSLANTAACCLETMVNPVVLVNVEVDDARTTVGSSASVDIWVRDFPDDGFGLGAYRVAVGYDSAMLEVTGVSPGDPPFDSPIFVVHPDLVSITQFSTMWPGPTGDIRIADLEFKSLAEGETTLALTVQTLANVNGDRLSTNPADGTITQLALEAEVSVSEEQDEYNVVVISTIIAGVKHPETGETVSNVPIGCYEARALYDPAGIAMLGVGPGDSPFDNPDYGIDNPGGSTTFGQCTEGAEPPVAVARLVPSLVGCTNDSYDLEVTFDLIADPQAAEIPQEEAKSLTFQRGDIKADGNVNIIDAMFGAQYLVGIRPIEQIRPLNMASVRHDGPDGDRKDIIDCMFIAQYVVGLRDCYFELVP